MKVKKQVSVFLVFMLFAPEIIRESLINQQDEQAALIALSSKHALYIRFLFFRGV